MFIGRLFSARRPSLQWAVGLKRVCAVGAVANSAFAAKRKLLRASIRAMGTHDAVALEEAVASSLDPAGEGIDPTAQIALERLDAEDVPQVGYSSASTLHRSRSNHRKLPVESANRPIPPRDVRRTVRRPPP